MDQSKTLSEVVQQIRQLLPVIAQQYQVKSIGVFGSYVKKQQRKESDLDLLVTFYDPPSLFKYIELENFLSDQLEIKSRPGDARCAQTINKRKSFGRSANPMKTERIKESVKVVYVCGWRFAPAAHIDNLHTLLRMV